MTHYPSNLDPVLTMIDLVTIDITSALTVLTGFICTHVYRTSETSPETYRQTFIFFVADMWLSTVLACFFGSLYAFSVQRFQSQDIPLTLLDGLTSVRQLEFNQAKTAPHTLNPFAWPVICMFIPSQLE